MEYNKAPFTVGKFINGEMVLHNMNGPAIIRSNGIEEWYINGQKCFCKTQEEFEKVKKLKGFW